MELRVPDLYKCPNPNMGRRLRPHPDSCSDYIDCAFQSGNDLGNKSCAVGLVFNPEYTGGLYCVRLSDRPIQACLDYQRPVLGIENNDKNSK